jgi:glycosyltransferase involved in cell wall biosynthesis
MSVVKGMRLPRNHVGSPRVVITMPAYNAEATLARTVAEIPDGLADRLILVDDASPDNTVQLARELGIEVHVHPENRGYGGNQKTCYSMALRDDADVVVMLHPDYQYEPRAVPLLIAPILAGDADMTFGSRFAGLSDPRSGGMPAHRYLGNRATTLVENLLLGSRFSEMHSGMRAYTRRCLLSLPFRRYSNDFVFDSQLLVDAVTTGQSVIEVPIPTRYTDESSSIGVRSSFVYVAGSLGYCARRVWGHGRKHYRAPRGRRETGSPSARRLADRRAGFLEWALAALGGYYLPGERLHLVGAIPGQARLATSAGWSPVDSLPARGAARIDAVVVADWDAVGDLGGLRTLRPNVHPDGLLALVVPCLRGKRPDGPFLEPVGPEALEAALGDADFALVEWTRLPRAAARAYRRWSTASKQSAPATDRSDIALAVARPTSTGLVHV